MLSKLIINENDLSSLVGKIFLRVNEKNHNLINPSNKCFAMEKRILILVSSNGKYGFAHFNDYYNIHFYEPKDFVTIVNKHSSRFYSLATPKQLEQIHSWMIEDLIDIN